MSLPAPPPEERNHCPTCGSPVRVHTSDEGTSSYVPDRVDVDALVAVVESFWLKRSMPTKPKNALHDLAALAKRAKAAGECEVCFTDSWEPTPDGLRCQLCAANERLFRAEGERDRFNNNWEVAVNERKAAEADLSTARTQIIGWRRRAEAAEKRLAEVEQALEEEKALRMRLLDALHEAQEARAALAGEQ